MSSKNVGNGSTQEKILQESKRLFLEKGYHGTSIDDITRAAGLTKGALYWHFKNKEELLKRIVEEFEERFLNNLILTVEAVKGGVLDKFEKYIHFSSSFAYYNRELCVSFETLAAELVGAHDIVEPEFRRIYNKYQTFLSALIMQGNKDGVFKEELDPNLSALTIMAIQHGVLFQWSMNRDVINGEIFVKTFKKILLYGLKSGL